MYLCMCVCVTALPLEVFVNQLLLGIAELKFFKMSDKLSDLQIQTFKYIILYNHKNFVT